ncbi:MAG: prepilin peptidase [Candidatus Tectomicrobia bacterium]|uniref:Prepilin leader peptidase/N-methyltransferase n=1 Tax=Tectimicrobiota bacterium TaxID=2528274 RepID=A0A932GS92_UNCTE|nr:prepilin peptidase [Candidatus Tectomicrobia bacterium]
MTELLPLLGAFVLGTTIGSFANVCIFRLPRRQSLIAPASHCPRCNAAILPHQNVPILSYLFLRGRCARCREPISVRYPLVELLTGVLFLLVYRKLGPTWQGVEAAVLLSALVVVSFIDLEHKLVPDMITLPGIAVGLLFGFLVSMNHVLDLLLGVLLGGGLFYLIALVSRGGMGGGDIKLIAMIGAFVGWQLTLVTIFAGILLGSLVAIALLILGLKGRKDMIPFGPFLALGAVGALFYGKVIIFWYLSLMG